MNQLKYNSTAFSLFHCYIDGSLSLTSPEKDYELIEVLGRDGALAIYNDRFRNVELEIPCFIDTNFIANYRSLLAFLNSQNGYQKLEITTEPLHFRKALFMSLTQPEIDQNYKSGRFSIVFNTMPQRWLASGESWETFTADGSIDNPTLFNAKPIIRIYGSGDVGVGSETITLTQAGTNYVDVDCDIMDAYEGSTSFNQYLTVTDFPTLASGSNGITLGTGVTKVEVKPRWFEI